eukprot:SAG31_NODE_16785_length_696_cov_0.830821_1_plen_64_part_00
MATTNVDRYYSSYDRYRKFISGDTVPGYWWSAVEWLWVQLYLGIVPPTFGGTWVPLSSTSVHY